MAPTFVASALSFTVVTTGPTMPPRCTAATGRSWVSRAYADGDLRGLRGRGLGPLPAGLAVQYLPAPLHLSFAVHAVAVVGCLVLVLSAPETELPVVGAASQGGVGIGGGVHGGGGRAGGRGYGRVAPPAAGSRFVGNTTHRMTQYM